jgi:hypothetical protein
MFMTCENKPDFKIFAYHLMHIQSNYISDSPFTLHKLKQATADRHATDAVLPTSYTEANKTEECGDCAQRNNTRACALFHSITSRSAPLAGKKKKRICHRTSVSFFAASFV